MGKIRKFLYLPSSERLVFVKSVILLFLVRFVLFIFPFKTVLNLLEWAKSKSMKPRYVKGIDSDRIARAVEVSSRYIPFTKCLAKALVTQMLFANYGYLSQLRIGVKKDGPERIKAHAWVESQGQIVMGNLENLSQFNPLAPLKPEKS